MERSKALMKPMTSVSFEFSGFGVTVISDPSPGILNSIITRITGTATSKGRHLLRLFSKNSFERWCCLPGLNYLRFLIFQMERSPLFDLSEVTRFWMSSENISCCQRISFTPTFVPELSLPCTKSKFTRGRNWLFACPMSSLSRLVLNHRLGYRCIDTS